MTTSLLRDGQRLVASNGGTIACTIEGQGPPIVLCHGGEADSRMFRHLVPHLSSDLTVITYDQRDTGATQFDPVDYKMADHADDLAGLISGLGYERAHVLGTSYGSSIAQELALRHPSRLHCLVLSVSTRGVGQPLTDEAQAGLEALIESKGQDPAVASHLVSLMFSSEGMARFPGLAEELLELRPVRTPEGHARRLAASQQFSLDAREGRLAEVDVPTLVITGFGDRMVRPEESWALALELGSASLAVLGGAGHVWPLEAPQHGAAFIRAFLCDPLAI